MARGYEAMKRQTTSYDYEKVFFNSAFGLGLVGLGWIAVKLGWMISGVQRNIEYLTDPAKAGLIAYRELVKWVEGENKDKDYMELANDQPFATAVYIYRTNPDAWLSYKEGFQAEHPEYFTDAGGLKDQPMDAAQVLQIIDNFMARWGAVMPMGVLIGNVGFEYLRVWRMKRRLAD